MSDIPEHPMWPPGSVALAPDRAIANWDGRAPSRSGEPANPMSGDMFSMRDTSNYIDFMYTKVCVSCSSLDFVWKSMKKVGDFKENDEL